MHSVPQIFCDTTTDAGLGGDFSLVKECPWTQRQGKKLCEQSQTGCVAKNSSHAISGVNRSQSLKFFYYA